MIIRDMTPRRQLAMQKVRDSIRASAGTTVAFSGIAGDDARMALAAISAGARILEPNHGERALAMGYKGAKEMHETVPVRHEIPIDEMVRVVTGIRNVVGSEIYITVGAPGNFTEPTPLLSDEHAAMLQQAGADGLHTHKSTLEEVREIVDVAHRHGLAVDAYVSDPRIDHPFGVLAATPEEVAEVAANMERIGVDIIGLMTEMSYAGAGAGSIGSHIKQRLKALVGAVQCPTAIEGGINLSNYRAVMDTGVNILFVGTAVTDAAREAVAGTVRSLLSR